MARGLAGGGGMVTGQIDTCIRIMNGVHIIGPCPLEETISDLFPLGTKVL